MHDLLVFLLCFRYRNGVEGLFVFRVVPLVKEKISINDNDIKQIKFLSFSLLCYHSQFLS